MPAVTQAQIDAGCICDGCTFCLKWLKEGQGYGPGGLTCGITLSKTNKKWLKCKDCMDVQDAKERAMKKENFRKNSRPPTPSGSDGSPIEPGSTPPEYRRRLFEQRREPGREFERLPRGCRAAADAAGRRRRADFVEEDARARAEEDGPGDEDDGALAVARPPVAADRCGDR